MATSYSTGTVSITNGSATLTGSGTAWITNGVQAGDIFEANGLTIEISAVGSNTSITLTRAWPGATISGNDYSIRFVPQATRVLTQTNALLAQLANGLLSGLSSVSSPAADKLAYLTGASTWGLISFKSWARSVLGAADDAAGRTAFGLGASSDVTFADGSFVDLNSSGLITGGFGARSTTGTLDWDDVTNARPGSGYTLMRGSDSSNGPESGAEYFHPFSFEYGTKNGSGNMSQFAIPYKSTGGVYLRHRFSSSWSSWRQFVTADANGNVGPLAVLTTAYPGFGVYRDLDASSSSVGQGIALGARNGSTPTASGRINSILNSGTSGTLTFETLTAGTLTTKMAITADGKVGIGTTSPSARLDIESPDTSVAEFRSLNASNTSEIILRSAGGIGSGASRGRIVGGYVAGGSDYGGYLAFTTNTHGNIDTERMRINSTGYVGVGTAAPSAQLHTTGTTRLAALGAGTLTADASGNVTSSSDERLKTGIVPFERGLDEITQINPISYHWNAASGLDQMTEYSGFSSQNVLTAIPEAIGVGANGYMGIDLRPVVAALVNAVKTLKEQNEDLEERIEALEA